MENKLKEFIEANKEMAELLVQDVNEHWRGKAYFYAMHKELEAITGEVIDEDEFSKFLDQQSSEISSALESAWNDWK